MAERWNPLDLGKLDPGADGLSECLAWGIGSAKALAESLYELDQRTSEVSTKEGIERRVFLCRLIMDRLYQAEDFLWNLYEKLSIKERHGNEQSSRRDREAEIFKSKKMIVSLSTKHPFSMYGLPVLIVNGCTTRPDSVLPCGTTARDLVRQFFEDRDPGSGTWGDRTHEAVEMADVFLRTADLLQCEDPGNNASVPAMEKSA
ncbi:MAG TPA: hypothetical protein PKY58_04920 [Syntrophales bacterium]|nr:hypothetical protein [Syntrophales bacterium]HQN77979.1 hypothetical protein [Syntrophales bacterium]HQQ26849.1 hypothetical protein [Syntrophales bacterium]